MMQVIIIANNFAVFCMCEHFFEVINNSIVFSLLIINRFKLFVHNASKRIEFFIVKKFAVFFELYKKNFLI